MTGFSGRGQYAKAEAECKGKRMVRGGKAHSIAPQRSHEELAIPFGQGRQPL